jgi:exodeoxyribonuclease V alpha subunit
MADEPECSGSPESDQGLRRVLNLNLLATVERFGWGFSPGNRVMETQNDYDREVFNGNLGIIDRIDAEDGAIVVPSEEPDVIYPFGEFDRLVPAFATAIHQFVGSKM